ncbi:spore protease YyaC [Jeotgalibacillus proteolyticus]|uniref:Spore protease YyaC n=1 Tax=Jeotgalibacillus proteolyticus TaxID=2082395 RepID=A0A2S5G659_9BACL|nr:spore protease YyaC [Jeotgalibacillus proteolyticus]PPA68488.1 spore protease YyaC [Jeotgalibacillus proteolyticus]
MTMNLQPSRQPLRSTSYRSHMDDPMTAHFLSKELAQRYPSSVESIVFVCIGTDRSTGDSLGPIIGTLVQKRSLSQVHIYGTLKNPVHALNLEKTIKLIEKVHPDAFIVGIDACLGQQTSVGFIEIGNGPVRPGAGVQKKLPDVGHIHIMGIVNVGGYMELTMLHNTRLYVVTEMANIIADAIHYSHILRRKNHTGTRNILTSGRPTIPDTSKQERQ